MRFQERLAYEVGMNRAHLSEIETGKARVGLEILEKIADELGVEGAHLLTRKGARSGFGTGLLVLRGLKIRPHSVRAGCQRVI